MEEEVQRGCGSLFGRIADFLPCASWRRRPEAGEESGPILHPPTGNLAECLIPPSVPGLYSEVSSEDLHAKDTGFDRGATTDVRGGSWEINTGRGAIDSPPHTPRTGRQRKGHITGGAGDSPGDRQAAAIELKEAGANPLLGQFHLEGKGQFVKDKLPVLQKPPAPNVVVNGRSSQDGLDSPDLLDLNDHDTGFDPVEDDLT